MRTTLTLRNALQLLTLTSTSPLASSYIRRHPFRPSHPATPSSSPSPSAHSAAASEHVPTIKPDDFKLYPTFFTLDETRQLLAMSLAKLDSVDSIVKRRRRMEKRKGASVRVGGKRGMEGGGVLKEMFEGEYDFQEGHYDSVIHQYRESLLSILPPSPIPTPSYPYAWPDYTSLMQRIYALLPTTPASAPTPTSSLNDQYAPPAGSTTHVLHLAPNGDIQAHVDNVEASGSVIIGVSLGAERVLRLREKGSAGGASNGQGNAEGREGEEGPGTGWDVLLPNGSLYIQRDSVRYQYEHSILSYDDPGSHWNGRPLQRGHRLSLMVRDSASKRE